VAERIGSSIFVAVVGVAIGFLAQRSRMCFVAGFRDYILVRDRELLLGLFAFLTTIWLLTSALYTFGVLEQRMPQYGELQARSSVAPVDRGAFPERLGDNLRNIRILSAGEPTRPISGLLGRFFYVSLAGGWLLGFLSVFAGGCVLRQHVLCAQGSRNSLLFLTGFYSATLVYYLVVFDRIVWVYQ